MNQDFVDLIRAFFAADARFLIVGAYALALHGRPRATGDLDILVDPTTENATRVFQALASFGAPLTGITPEDFVTPGVVFQIGLPPRRIDVLTSLTGVTFDEAWRGRVRGSLGPVDVDFLGREALIQNKRATARPRDLADLADLEAGDEADGAD